MEKNLSLFSELAPALMANNSSVIGHMQKEKYIQTSFDIKRNEYVSYLFEKKTFYDVQGKLFGTIYHHRGLRHSSALHFTDNFPPFFCRFTLLISLFTKKECC